MQKVIFSIFYYKKYIFGGKKAMKKHLFTLMLYIK